MRAAIKNIRSGRAVQGGSTITSSWCASCTPTGPERDYKRKIREAKLAEELENERSKDWILTNYINSVPYGTVGGQTAVGAQAAARVFFNKTGRRADAARGGDPARRPAAGAVALQPVPRPAGRAAAPQQRARPHAGAGNDQRAEQASRARASRLGRRAQHYYYTKRREAYFFDYVKEELIERYGAGGRAQGRPEDPHHDRPRQAEQARQAIGSSLRRRPLVGDRLDRPPQRLHPRDGLVLGLRRLESTTSPPRVAVRRARPSRRWC